MQRDPRQEWFRKTSWRPPDRDEFFARLARARGSRSKAQYVRIQASHLQQVGLLTQALELLDLMIAEYPDSLQLASAYLQRAQCLAGLGREAEAVTAYLDALRQERTFPNARTDAWIDFGWFVVKQGRTDLYGKALQVINDEAKPVLLLPIDRYRLSAIQAFIAADRGDRQGARAHATAALQAATESQSGLRHHPKLGLVKETEGKLHKRLWSLAG